MKIYKWNEIGKYFEHGVILGNGASIAIDKKFAYASLFENARQKGWITKNVATVFKYLDTEDFELVLQMLWHCYHINRALQIGDAKTSRAYKALRAALILSVRDIHVEYREVADSLLSVATFLKPFKTVVSLNYDFLVYWAILAGNGQWGEQRFKDCFINGAFDEDWDRLRQPHNGAAGSSLIFYPHGNLVLATDLVGDERKVVNDDSEHLLDTVVRKWESDKYTPLFVSEGNSNQKLQSINRSPYLRTVYNSVLPKLGSNVVIFGWSMGSQDDHILKAICSNEDLKTVAVSVRRRRNFEKKCAYIESRISEYSDNGSLKLVFFDADSKDCWVNH